MFLCGARKGLVAATPGKSHCRGGCPSPERLVRADAQLVGKARRPADRDALLWTHGVARQPLCQLLRQLNDILTRVLAHIAAAALSHGFQLISVLEQAADRLCGIGVPGFNPEVVQHTNWDYGRNGKGFYNDIFAPAWAIASLWELYSPNRTVQFLQQRR